MNTKNTCAVWIFIIILLQSFPDTLKAQNSINVEGEITADTTWSADTIKVIGDLVVNDDVVLTIDPGTHVEFQGFYEMEVKGTVIAVGAPGDSIIFTCHPDSTASGWNGLYFYDFMGKMMDNDTSTFSCCVFEYGKKFRSNDRGGVFHIRFYTGLQIERSLFRYNISDRYGGSIYCGEQADIVIQNCIFIHNEAPDGSAITCHTSDPLIRNNRFISNIGETLHLIYGSRPTIVNNLFAGNDGKGIYCYISNPKISGNILINNSDAIYVDNADPDIRNNTICNNTRGLYFEKVSKSTIYNTIIWGNDEQVYLDGESTQPDFYYCDIDGGAAGFNGAGADFFIGAMDSIINSDPVFILPTPGSGVENYTPVSDWSLQINSPCINTGYPDNSENSVEMNDYIGNPRISYSRIDMGAVEFQQDFIIPGDTISVDTSYFADTLKINKDLVIDDEVTFTIPPGTIVEFQDNYKIEVKGVIRSIGSENDTITFTINDTAGFYNMELPDGGWGGIQFSGGGSMYDNDTSIFKYCKFQYGKAIGMTKGGAIRCLSFSKVQIENCSFTYNTSAEQGGAIFFNSSEILLINNYFAYNKGVRSGGAFYSNYGKITLSRNIFYKNDAGYYRGGAIGINRSDVAICSDNIFSNNYARQGGAILLDNTKEALLVNNLICNNTASWKGGGIYFYQAEDVTMINNTIVNNAGGGLFLENDDPVIYNTIIRGNQPYQVFLEFFKAQPDFYYSNIEGGKDSIQIEEYWFEGREYAGTYENNQDADPYFVNPTDSAGIANNGLEADWSLISLSPCINAGTRDIDGFDLPVHDLLGNPRLNSYSVDIGAIEDQSEDPFFTKQPVNQIKCVGDTVLLDVMASDDVFYQWQKDGEDIPDATESIYLMDSVQSLDEGNYQCLISNAYDTVSSANVFFGVRVPPAILSQPDNSWIGKDEKASLRIFATGTEPGYQWRKDGIELVDEKTDEVIIPSTGYEHEGSYDCIIRNACGADSTDAVNLFVAPEICMVTVDPATGNNLVVWEKNTIAPLAGYNIYRESNYAGIYDKIGAIPYDDLSVMLDSVADPTEQAYLYKITAVDTSGYETDPDLSKTHKTIHLLVTTNPETNATQLDWDRYVGFDYGSYEIFRSETSSNFTSLDLKSSSTSTWADPDPGETTKFYRIGAVKPVPCYPTGAGLKVDSGPYSHSMSNVDDNRLQINSVGNIEQLSTALEIYPNPFSESATIRFENPSGCDYTLRITDFSGKIYRVVNNITTSEVILENENLSAGIYFVELRGERVFRGKLVVE